MSPSPSRVTVDIDVATEAIVDNAKLAALMAERDRLLDFVQWVAGYETERQLVGSGVIEKARMLP